MACAEMETCEEKITCSICSDRFTKPKALPCLHTFCRHCLDRYIQSQAAGHEGIRTFSCPICRRDTSPPDASISVSEWADQFPTNQYAITLMEYRDLSKESITSPERAGCDHQELLSVQTTCEFGANINGLSVGAYITAAVFFPDGTLSLAFEGKMITSTGNPRCIGYYDISCMRMFSTTMTGASDMAAISGYTLAVTYGRKLTVFEKQEDKFVEKKGINISNLCHGISNVADRGILVSCSGSPCTIRAFRSDGKPEYMFYMNQGKVNPTGITRIATNATASCIVVTDSEQNCIHCYSSEGKLRWEKSIPGASGVVLLGSYILVAAKTDGKVLVLDTEGNIVNILIDSKHGIKNPEILALSTDEKRLLVVEERSTIVKIFRVLKPHTVNDLFTC